MQRISPDVSGPMLLAGQTISVQPTLDQSRSVNPGEYYRNVFSPDAVGQQIVRLCQIFGITCRDLKGIEALAIFPEDEPSITGFAVSIDYRFLSGVENDNYSVALQRLFMTMYQKNIRIQNDVEGRIIGNFEIDPFAKKFQETVPSFGPFRIFPINTGHKWSRITTGEAKTEMQKAAAKKKRGEWIEFPITSFDCLCLYMSHPDRMLHKNVIMPISGGDIFAPDEDGISCFSPKFTHDSSGKKFLVTYNRKVSNGDEGGHHSVWTAFVRK